jgi:hypothetical protein
MGFNFSSFILHFFARIPYGNQFFIHDSNVSARILGHELAEMFNNPDVIFVHCFLQKNITYVINFKKFFKVSQLLTGRSQWGFFGRQDQGGGLGKILGGRKLKKEFLKITPIYLQSRHALRIEDFRLKSSGRVSI